MHCCRANKKVLTNTKEGGHIQFPIYSHKQQQLNMILDTVRKGRII